MAPATPAAQLAGFMAKYTPAMAKEGRAALMRMRRLVPGAVRMVYDNWNGLVVGFGPTGGLRLRERRGQRRSSVGGRHVCGLRPGGRNMRTMKIAVSRPR